MYGPSGLTYWTEYTLEHTVLIALNQNYYGV